VDARSVTTLAIVLAVYAMLAIPALPRRAERFLAQEGRRAWAARLFARPGLALAGALLVVLVGAVAPLAAWRAINWGTLALLTGMMLLVAALERANVFEVIASRLVRRFATPARLLAGSMLVVAVLSALVLNDAVVLLFTPVLVQAARSMRVSPFPLLAGEAFAANLGSAATPVGNPQNVAIALAKGISFVDWAARLALVALVALALGITVCALAFRRALAAPPHKADVPLARLASARMATVAFGCVGLALAGFVVGPALGVPLWASAFGAGLLALALSPVGGASPARLARGVDVGILVFFVGLFVLLAAVETTGVTRLVAGALARSGSGGFVATTAVLSNVVSNVPAVFLLLPSVGSTAQALLLGVASTFAGNLTFFGSAATVIVAETARARGEEFDAGRFTAVGLVVGTLTLLLAWLWVG
jgi:Na+/H+ antiporter NhaD/arsenite permease-like protein